MQTNNFTAQIVELIGEIPQNSNPKQLYTNAHPTQEQFVKLLGLLWALRRGYDYNANDFSFHYTLNELWGYLEHDYIFLCVHREYYHVHIPKTIQLRRSHLHDVIVGEIDFELLALERGW